MTVTTDGAANPSWNLTLAGDRSGEVLTATATDLATHDTSELSSARVVA